MTPADAKDWWLAAAALSSAFIPSAQAQDKPATVPEKAGVVSGVQPGVKSTTSERVIYVGSDAYRGEKFVTDANGSLHILFMDQSSMTLGPNSELTIDEFVYDPNAKKGKIGVSLASGLLRVVGGQISKSNETTVKTASGTIGIRGGISTVEQSGNNTSATFLFGQQMRVSDNSGNTNTVTRPGFGSSLGSGGLGPTTRTDPNTLQSSLNRFSDSSGGSSNNVGGAAGGGLISAGSAGSRLGAGGGGGGGLARDRVSSEVSTTLENNPPSSFRPTQSQDVVQNSTRQVTPPVPIS
jgi:hypothetical protein